MMEPKKFVVRQLPNEKSGFSQSKILLLLMLFCCAVAVVVRNNKTQQPLATISSLVIGTFLMLVLGSRLFPSSSSTDSSKIAASVTVYPLGVQIWNQANNNSTPLFIPIDAILDVIILEMVHAYKVTNSVMFRVVKSSSTTTASTSNSTALLLQEDKVVLVPAFAGVDTMSYTDCQTMWQALSKSLGKM